jgi:NAD(P)-dependent dehydrogenase (short-subunit alcohol dehydrogenase family)
MALKCPATAMNESATRIRWTASLMESQASRHYVITGANSGLGFENVKALAAHGAHITMAVRQPDKALAAIASEIPASLHAQIEVKQLDLADLASIRAFAESMSSPIDCLINNAGVMAPPFQRTTDGFELQFGTNHLGHFALTALLWDRIRAGHRPTIVTVSSNAHKPGNIDFENLNAEKKYSAWGAYSQSKLANLLFAFEIANKVKETGGNVRSVAAHPGYSATNLSSSVSPNLPNPMKKFFRGLEQVIAQSAEMGALPQLYAAVSHEVPASAYVGPDGWGEFRGYPKLVTPTERARDVQLGQRLWRASEELTGIRFQIS